MRFRFRLLCGILFFSGLTVFAQCPADPSGTQALSTSAMQNYRSGRDFESRNRTAEAEAAYNEAIRICQDEVSRNAATRDTYTAITWSLQRQRKYADVVIWGERGLRLYSDEYRILETMGEAYFYLNDYDRSLNFMQRYANALPQGERISVAYFFIGEIFRLKQKYRHADIAYTTAVRLEPAIALWWYRLASVRESVGDTAPAIQAYERALQLNPSYQ
jgi:tetratricopeptide (TPR) repeat protein